MEAVTSTSSAPPDTLTAERSVEALAAVISSSAPGSSLVAPVATLLISTTEGPSSIVTTALESAVAAVTASAKVSYFVVVSPTVIDATYLPCLTPNLPPSSSAGIYPVAQNFSSTALLNVPPDTPIAVAFTYSAFALSFVLIVFELKIYLQTH